MEGLGKLSYDEVKAVLTAFDEKPNEQTEQPFAQLYAMSDSDLLLAYASGTQQAARILVERLMPKIRSHSYCRLGNVEDAEDVTQEAFLRLWKVASTWEEDRAEVSTWLYRVVINLCNDRHRRKTLYELDTISELADDTRSPADELDDKHRQKALYSAMLELPVRQGLAVQLRHIDELNNSEIAEIMDLSVEAVESLTARGKRKLMEILQIQKSEIGYTNG